MGDKNLVFTVTHGRTGTTFLTELFKLFDNTLSLHEPEPNYASVFPTVKQDPRHAIPFLEKKLAHIDTIRERNYVETSNVFGKGFLIPLLRLGITPGLIFLNRNFRATADSLFQRGSTPIRSENGRRYSADPTTPGSLPIHNVDQLTDYQLCYWGVLDAFHRQLEAMRIYDEQGLQQYCWATVSDFHNFDQLVTTGANFGLQISEPDSARSRHEQITQVHHNPNRSGGQARHIADPNREELEVLDRVAWYDPQFVKAALESDFVEASVVTGLGLS